MLLTPLGDMGRPGFAESARPCVLPQRPSACCSGEGDMRLHQGVGPKTDRQTWRQASSHFRVTGIIPSYIRAQGVLGCVGCGGRGQMWLLSGPIPSPGGTGCRQALPLLSPM